MPRLIALIVLVTWSGLAFAEKQPLACQYLAAVGLIWENGQWNRAEFKPDPPFILVMDGDFLTQESVAEALEIPPEYARQVSCRNLRPAVSCTDVAGAHLYFDPRTNRGGVSMLIGVTSEGTNPDPVYVTPFTCQKF